ncbi:MAG: hypothetical protein E6J42_06505 [Chloroflexi bacterium]|nr:MAG: hypothetical protein E6J42_06505 [Chloroflexota bacterium]
MREIPDAAVGRGEPEDGAEKEQDGEPDLCRFVLHEFAYDQEDDRRRYRGEDYGDKRLVHFQPKDGDAR